MLPPLMVSEDEIEAIVLARQLGGGPH